jgi:hypothetical protein
MSGIDSNVFFTTTSTATTAATTTTTANCFNVAISAEMFC